jgi:HAD superfamily hydrolase (TIGR01509 family)
MTLKAVIFDLGGTLVEMREGYTAEAVLARAAPAAIRLLPAEQAARLDPAAVGVAVRRAYVELEEAACAGDRSPVPAELAVMRAMAGLGITVDAETARAMLAALYVSERDTNRLLPGAAETLHALVGMGLRLGIISNRMHGGTLLLDDLGYYGISHLFSGMVASCDAGQMKPHPAVFRLALEELGASPEEAVMVGDDLCADIEGGLAVGMRAVWVRRPPDRTDEPPEGVPSIRRLDELPPTIARMRAAEVE